MNQQQRRVDVLFQQLMEFSTIIHRSIAESIIIKLAVKAMRKLKSTLSSNFNTNNRGILLSNYVSEDSKILRKSSRIIQECCSNGA